MACCAGTVEASPPRVAKTAWEWDLFFNSLLEGNSDVRQFLIHPHTDLDAYVAARKKRRAQNITSAGCQEAKNFLLESNNMRLCW